MYRIYSTILIFSLIFPQVANACESGNSDHTFDRSDWVKIQRITKNNSMSINREPVLKSVIMEIMGFSGKCSTSANGRIEQCVWIDGNNCKKKIKAKFRDQELSAISKLGF